MARIFISYRRADSELIAGLISQRLRERFGPDSAYLDTDAVPLGVDFRDHIKTAVGQCDVLLAVIGDGWIGSINDLNSGNARDFVRLEIESALDRGIPVVPVLVGQATMPAESDLPSSLQSLTFRNAAEVRAGRDLDQHLERLVQGIETHVPVDVTSGDGRQSDNVGPPSLRDTIDQQTRTTSKGLLPEIVVVGLTVVAGSVGAYLNYAFTYSHPLEAAIPTWIGGVIIALVLYKWRRRSGR